MFNFFRNRSSKDSSSSSSSPGRAPPTAQARREKEQRWFNSQQSNNKSQPQQPAIARAHASTSRLVPGGSGDSLQESPRAGGVEGLRATGGAVGGSGASLKSRGSRIFNLGGGGGEKQRKASTTSIPPSSAAPGNGYAASAPNPHARGGRTSPPPPPLPTSPPRQPPSNTDAGTKTLATRLQELATSHADGLLDEEEYRLLRTELFERYAAKSTTAAQSSADGSNFPSLTKSPNIATSTSPALQPLPASPQQPSPNPTASLKSPRPPSFLSVNSRNTTRSTSGFRSLFRRSTTTLRADAEDADRWELLDADSPNNSPGPRSPQSSVGHGDYSPDVNRARTLRNHPALASASLSPSLSFSANSRSSYGHGTRAGSSMRSADSVRSGGGGSRLTGSLLSAASPTMLPPMASSRDPFLLAAADKEPTSKELKQEIEELERERKRLEDSWKSLERAALAKAGGTAVQDASPTLEIGSPSTQNGNRVSTLLRKASFNSRPESIHGGTGLGLNTTGASGRLTPIASSPRASPILQIGLESPRKLSSRSSSPNLANGAAGSFTSSIPAGLLAANAGEEDIERSPDPSGLAVEEVRRRRRATDERYEKRLEYLRARLRGALLKEGLRG